MTEAKISQNTVVLDKIEDAIEDIKNGKIIIVVDDEDRENEGDFICAAELVTSEQINFMARYGRGLICTPIESSRAKELDLELMVKKNSALHETAFTVSIDLLGQGCTTGISAYDRSTGIRAIVSPDTLASDFARPGHIFPLIAKSGGVLRRTGHTEATIDLARLAGLYPAGVLTEILNEDGSMARLPQLMDIAEEHDLKLISIKDLVAYRMKTERLVEKEMTTTLQTKYGEFNVAAYRQINTDDVHVAISMGNINSEDPILTKVHSNTETGDILGILFDGYADKLHSALYKISEEGKGVLLYIRHGEKGNEIIEKLKELDTNPDNNPSASTEQRDFGVGAQILRDLGVQKIKLMTSNPRKRVGLIGYGLEIVENIEMP
ncbi:MAG: 3,4-dihydroxy-2-butanone-4-phosphate synthase [Saprospiraceae bacterium]|jgi:3,4-dihydroxy 2-butanone 4-phosphate synthase/GTP cyclohydrolase II|nr:3,4-dihydroxy-2-butanone-4-phosphate synthase [Saprospiraceae bacterium]